VNALKNRLWKKPPSFKDIVYQISNLKDIQFNYLHSLNKGKQQIFFVNVFENIIISVNKAIEMGQIL
jgi:hypothetical protein